MRSDLTTSERAVASAVAWKRLFPEQGHGGDRKSNKNQTPKIGFESFAKDNFKIGKDYAGRALAIANYSPELLEAAKDSLDGAYKTYQAEKLKREEVQHRPEGHDRRQAPALLRCAGEGEDGKRQAQRRCGKNSGG